MVHRMNSLLAQKVDLMASPHTSAFRCKADITIAACLLLWSLLGAKRTCPFALHMSAIDPKRTCRSASPPHYHIGLSVR